MRAYWVAFLSGAVVLVLELLGARIVAPVYGATVPVWAAVITVTLASLAVGYSVGGALADKARALEALGILLGLAGFWIAVLPYLRRPVLVATSACGMRLGAFLSALVLFGVPLAGLGGVGPLCVRLRAQDPSRIGREVGGVYAVSTLGSVLGALAAGFYLIGHFKVTVILAALSGITFLLAAACFWAGRRGAGLAACAAALLAAGSARISTARADGVLFHEGSFYGDLKVMDRPEGVRVFYIDGLPNTVASIGDLQSTSDYIRFLELLAFLRPQGRKALLVGLGGGSLPGILAEHYGLSTDVVEIDPKVLRVARDYFGFKPPGQVFLEDGRVFLERGGPAYDFIVLDAFSGDRHPYQLISREAFEAAHRRLKPGGILAMNLIGYGAGPQSGLMRSAVKTLQAAFPHVRVFCANRSLDWSGSYANLIFLAADEPIELLRDPYGGRPELVNYYAYVASQFSGPDRDALLKAPGPEGVLITDDLNPVDDLSGPAFLSFRTALAKNQAGTFDD